MFCQNCGNKVEDGALFCDNCGAKIERPGADVPPEQQRSTQQTPPPRQQAQPIVIQQKTITESDLPVQYRPLSPWAYFGYNLLFAIPIVGFILLIVFSCSSDNINRRNYARSFWCSLILAVVIVVIVLIIVAATGGFYALSQRYY